MSDLVGLINHPGVPWGAGGLVGGIAGALIGQPDCTELAVGSSGLECAEAVMPLIGVPADAAVFIAVGTIIGVVVAYVVGKLNA